MTVLRVPVLMYHRIGESINTWEARYAIPAERFAAHMNALAQAGYVAVGIDDLLAWMDGRLDLPEGAFLITFDDGYLGVYEHAKILLERMCWPYTMFLVSDMIGQQDSWTSETNSGGVTYPLLNDPEIHDMSRGGCNFQSHSASHSRLPALDTASLRAELAGSRHALEERLGSTVNYLAYPYGQFDERVINEARSAGYSAAFSTQSGFNQRGTNRYAIRRIDVYGTDTAAMLLRKIRLGRNDGSLQGLLRYYLRRLFRFY